MATRRVNGPIFVTCPFCRTKFGPYQRLVLGGRTCGRCGRSFNVR